jgi:ubiquinone/menaquinone biosynthesis C-methylase UbiE/uncharacterized protein YbaR (Trm112 family)
MNPETRYAESVTHDWLELVVCPRDKKPLELEGDFLVCPDDHRYRVLEGVPILLVSEAQQTHIEGTRALALAESGDASQLARFQVGPEDIDPFVKNAIGATNGGLYQHLVGNLKEYPIPALRLPRGQGGLFLEVGSNWGRWCLAAQRLGYRPVGIDPSLKSVRAARRVAQQLGVRATYLVADGRFLPFPDGMFQTVFSYSVLQHLSKADVATVLPEIRRVLSPGGECLVQMPNVFGIRCFYHQARRGFRETREFEVRYWTAGELRKAFARIGPAQISVDGFFSLNAQISDVHLMPPRYRAIVYASEALRKASESVPALTYVADSLYVSARKAES